MTSPPPAPLRYWIDAQDRLIRLSENWSDFARENDGEALMPDLILGKVLWSEIADLTLRVLYHQLVALARQGRPIRYRFRCDSPTQRRLFEMEIRGTKSGLVEFASTLLETESRPAVPLLDSHQARSQELVRMCSWCQRIAVAGAWLPVESAMAELGLMERTVLPRLTHGICDECNAKVSAQIDAELNDGTRPEFD
jgi:hypothetical protein